MEKEVYKISIGVDVSGDESAKKKLRTIDKFMENTEKRGRILNRLRMSPVIQMVDRFSGKFKQIMRGRDELRRFTKTPWTVVVQLKDNFSKPFQRVASMRMPGFGGAGGLLVGAGGIYAGKQAFDITIGASAHMELYRTQIVALFRDQKKAAEYMNRMSQAAIVSPIMGEADIFGNSKSFISLTKDLDLLQRMWKNAELMAAMDPIQGIEGAVFALRELASGDAISMIERFEMPRKVMNEIKKLDLPQQVTALEKFFKEMGFDQEYLNKVGKTSIGLWTQITEKAKKAFRLMGEDGLNQIRPQLERFNNWLDGSQAKKLTEFGSTMVSGIVEATITGFDEMKRIIETRYLNNPEFQKLNFSGRVGFVAEDISRNFDEWFSSKGAPKIAEYGTLLGGEMIKSMGASALAAVQNSYLLSLLLGTYLGLKTPGPPQLKLAVILSIVGVQIATDIGAAIGEALNTYVAPYVPGTTKYTEKQLEKEAGKGIWGVDPDLSKRIYNTPEGEPVFKGNMTIQQAPETAGDKIKKFLIPRAIGGVFNQPHAALVAEAGPEAIIPLSSGMRSRGLALWQQAGQQLGVYPSAMPVAAGTGGINVNVSGISVQVGDGVDYEALAWKVGWKIVGEVKKALENRG